MLVFAYIVVCLVVALLGLNRRSGYVGALFMCFLMTPLVAFLVLWMTAPARKPQPVESAGPKPAARVAIGAPSGGVR